MTPEQKKRLDDLIGALEDACFAACGDLDRDVERARIAGDAIVAHVESMLAQARAEEREACAKVCEDRIYVLGSPVEPIYRACNLARNESATNCAAAIRARKDSPIIAPISDETMALAKRAVESQRMDTRTETEIVRDGVSFIMDGRKDGQ